MSRGMTLQRDNAVLDKNRHSNVFMGTLKVKYQRDSKTYLWDDRYTTSK